MFNWIVPKIEDFEIDQDFYDWCHSKDIDINKKQTGEQAVILTKLFQALYKEIK